VVGRYVEFTIVSATFGVENWTLTGAPNPLDITGERRTQVMASKTPDHQGLTLTGGVDVQIKGADLVISRTGPGLTMKIQAKDCANGGIFQMEPDQQTTVTHKLAPGIFFAHDYKGTCISGLKARKFPTPAPCNRLFGPACLVQYFPRRCGGRSPITMFRLYAKESHRLKLMRSYAVIATNSEHLTEEYKRHGFISHRLPYPVFADVKERPRAVRTDHGNTWRLLFVGRMDRLKGGQVLLEALPKVRAGIDRPGRPVDRRRSELA